MDSTGQPPVLSTDEQLTREQELHSKAVSARKYVLLVGLVALVCTYIFILVNIDSETPSQPTQSSQPIVVVAEEEPAPAVGEEPIANEELEALINSWVDQLPAQASVVLTDLNTGIETAVAPDIEHTTASIYKLFVAYALLLNDDANPGSLIQDFEDDTTFAECLRLMIIISDEDCSVALGWHVGWAVVDDYLDTIGLTSTTVNNYNANGSFNGDKKTTAREVASFLDQLYAGTLLSENNTDLLMKHLSNQEINDRLPTQIPEGISIAHKTGNLYDYVHDIGYITSDHGAPYSFVIMTSGWSDTELETAPRHFQSLLGDVIEFISEG